MNSDKKTARIAGLLYLITVVTGTFNLGYVPSKLVVWDNATTTFNNIVANETLFRLGILSALICYTAFLLLPFVLYKLLKPVNKSYAVLMVVFAVVSIPISFINIGNKFSILTLISKADFLKVDNIHEQVLFYLHLYSNGNQIASIFWGLWLFPFGYLVFKSGFLPKVLGILLMFGCFGYLIDFIGDFLFLNYNKTIISTFITKPGSIGEIGICLWLLIVGVKQNKRLKDKD